MLNNDLVRLYLFRMEACPDFGLRRELVVYSQYELDVLNYTISKLGQIVRTQQYRQVQVKLPELNGQPRLQAIVHRRAAEDFPIYCENVEAYTYPPYGKDASSFGFYSKTTIAWLHPHRDYPALLFKATSEDNVIAVSNFLGAICELDEVLPWPKQPEIKTIIAPVVRGGRMRPGERRKMQARSRALRRR